MSWNLRRIRTAQGVSQENLAVDADVDRSYVSGIERMEFNPTVDILDKLARALAVDVAEFLILPDPSRPMPEPLKRGRRPSR